MTEATTTEQPRLYGFGPPGTGKTGWLVRAIKRASIRYDIGEIVVGSFTKGAALEIADRAGMRESPNVGTLHALAYRLLDKPEIAETQLADWNAVARARHGERYTLSGKLAVKARKAAEGDDDSGEPTSATDVDDLRTDSGADADATDADATGDKLFLDYALLRARAGSRDELIAALDHAPVEVRKFAAAYERWKADADVIDFQGMIERCLWDGAYLPRSTQVAFWDEAQDFTRTEYELTSMWARQIPRNVWVGDDDQTIYAFKGADPKTLIADYLAMSPEQQAAALGTTHFVLKQSYRVPRAVVEFSLKWVGSVSARMPKQYAPRVDDAGAPVEGAVLRTEGSLADPGKWVRLVEAEIAAGRSVMLLATCGFQARKIVAALKEAGVPVWNRYAPTRGEYNPVGPVSRWVRTRKERIADDVPLGERIRLLRGARMTAADRVLAFALPGLDPDDAWTWGDVKLWASVLGSMKRDGVAAEGRVLQHGVKVWIEREAQTDATALGLDTIFDPDFYRDVIETGDVVLWAKAALAARDSAVEYPARVVAKRGAQALIAPPLVTVGTIHSVKGGEADTVIVFPDLSAKGAVEWASLRTRDPLIRLFYVAFTRAREKLILARASTPRKVW